MAGVELDGGDLLERVKHAPVTYGLVAALVLFFALGWLTSREDRDASTQQIAKVVRYFEESPFVEMTPRLMQEVGSARAAELHEIYTGERRKMGLPLVPARIKGMTQRRFNKLQTEAHDTLARLPDARFGVNDSESSPFRYLSHPFADASLLSLIISVVFLLWVGVVVEMAWGSALYGAFCVGAALVGGGMFSFAESATGLPWAGAGGIVAATMGAYTVRSAQGRGQGLLLVPVWMGVEALGVRGFSIADPSTISQVPLLTLGTLFGVGGLTAFVAGVIGWEGHRDQKQMATPAASANPALDLALGARDAGRHEEAFRALKEILRESPEDRQVALAFWDSARQIGRCKDAAPAMVRVVRDHLRAGRSQDAVEHWLELVAQVPTPNVESVLLVRMGESLLDEGHPDEATAAMKRAAGAGSKLSPVLARRVVRVARDLDPVLAQQAAKLALRDVDLQPDERADLTSLAGDRGPTQPSKGLSKEPPIDDAAASDAGVDPSPAAPVSRETPTELAASEALQRAAIETGLLRRDAPGSPGIGDDEPLAAPFAEDGSFLAAPDPETLPPPESKPVLPEPPERQPDPVDSPADAGDWNSPGIVEDLTDELSADDMSLSDLSAVAAESEDATEATIDTAVEYAASSQSEEATIALAVEPEVPASLERPPPRVRDGIPLSLREEGIEIEIADRGKTVLPYERIEALTLAAVEGLSAKPVLVVDAVIAWRVPLGEAVKTIRLRADRFDPCQVVPGQTSPLSALLTMVAELRKRASALPIPDESALRGDPFSSFPDLAAYESELLTPP